MRQGSFVRKGAAPAAGELPTLPGRRVEQPGLSNSLSSAVCVGGGRCAAAPAH